MLALCCRRIVAKFFFFIVWSKHKNVCFDPLMPLPYVTKQLLLRFSSEEKLAMKRKSRGKNYVSRKRDMTHACGM